MNSINVTTKNKLENLFRVKVNKCPVKKAELMSCIGSNACRCCGCKTIISVVHHPENAKNERYMRVLVLSK